MTTSKREDLGGKREIKDQHILTYTILACMKLYFLWASGFLKCQLTANVEKRIKSKLWNKQKKFKSFLSYKARCAHQGGRDKARLFNKVLPPPFFLDFNALEKSSHFMSTVLQNRNSNKFQHEYLKKKKKKHKIFPMFPRLDELTGRVCLPVLCRTPDQYEVI